MKYKEALDSIVNDGINLGAGDYVDLEALKIAADVLKKVITGEFVPDVHGRWEEHPDEYEICATEFDCSVCKESYCTSEMSDQQFIEMMKYCPNCGAKMDGGAENDRM